MAARRPRKAKPRWDLGQKLRLYMADKGLNQARFAKHVGVSATTLNAWLADTTPGARKLEQIAKATGLPGEYWLDEDVPYPPPADYMNTVEDLEDLLRTMTIEELAEWVAILSDPSARQRTLALWKASKVGGA